MRVPAQGGAFRARAIAGSYVIVLAWDTLDGTRPARTDLLGFAIERSELDLTDTVVEKYWLRGIKRFRDKDKGLPPGTPVPTADHPIQAFQWGDYTVHAGTKYRYRIVPVCGTPKHLQLVDADAVTVEVTTEATGAPEAGSIRHDVFFNRGVIGSQAYAREFGNRAPNPDDPLSPEMVWLSRGLYEALRGFIALAKDDEPLAVWTGSTNISAGGIFGHSNAAHVVWDKDVAQKYLDYWELLAKNLTPTKLRGPVRTTTPTPAGKTAKNSAVPLFSPRDDKDSNVTLQWYADRMNDATEIVCITVAFNLDEVFQNVIAQDNDVLRYIVKDDDLATGETIGNDHDVFFAAGGYLGEGALENFLKERDNPLNSNNYIHTKFMLVDPLGDDPLVVTGSANFSRPSQRINDENMLVIRGDTRVADIYFGEYMRIFDHHYARYVVRLLQNEGRSDPIAGYLKDTMNAWLPSQFDPESAKSKRRRYFVGLR